ncbi:hypothetical protein DMENIID0001_042460 [Sergentomyia squamirostris]
MMDDDETQLVSRSLEQYQQSMLKIDQSENRAGQVFKSPLFGESPPRTPGRSENRTPSNTPPTPGRGLELLPPVKVVIDHKERRLAEQGNQSPLVRRRWRASRLSETSSEEEPVGRIVAKAAEEILLEEASPAKLAKAAEILERALP